MVGLQPGTWFWNREVPARPNIARTVLHQLKNDPKQGIWRVAQGLYWRGWPEDHAYHARGPSTQVGSLILAGPGAGLAGWSALNSLGWTLQCPVTVQVSVCLPCKGRLPRPIGSSVFYYRNCNSRRLDLTWAEVTVLEAIPMMWYSEEPWQECLDNLVSGVSETRLGWGSEFTNIRPQMLTWASETEAKVSADTLHRIGDVASHISRHKEVKVSA